MPEYRVKRGDTLSRIAAKHDLSLNQLLAMNPRYKADPNRLGLGDRLQVPAAGEKPVNVAIATPSTPTAATQPGAVSATAASAAAASAAAASATAASTAATPAAAPTTASPPAARSATARQEAAAPAEPTDWFKVPMGQITFDAEGMEKPGSVYHSRQPHVPGAASGVTIGRGYDMGARTPEAIFDDLRAAGVPTVTARKLSRCAGYLGSSAKQYLADNKLKDLSITPEAQYRLFLSTYEELAGDVIRICEKHDVVEKYGATDWQQLDPIVRDIAVDLRYRGDYKPFTRKQVQPILVANSRARMKRLMANEDYWVGICKVPKDRFKRRRDYFA